MKKLHWLPLKYRIDFKMNLLTFKALNSGFPAYLKEYLTPFKSIKNTRRCNPDLNYLLEPNVIPRQHTSPSYFQSSYAYLAPVSGTRFQLMPDRLFLSSLFEEN